MSCLMACGFEPLVFFKRGYRHRFLVKSFKKVKLSKVSGFYVVLKNSVWREILFFAAWVSDHFPRDFESLENSNFTDSPREAIPAAIYGKATRCACSQAVSHANVTCCICIGMVSEMPSICEGWSLRVLVAWIVDHRVRWLLAFVPDISTFVLI